MIKWKKIKKQEISTNRQYLFTVMRKWWVHSNVLESVENAIGIIMLKMARSGNSKRNRSISFMQCLMSYSLML